MQKRMMLQKCLSWLNDMSKKNIVIGKTELDITKNILGLLNAKIKKVELN